MGRENRCGIWKRSRLAEWQVNEFEYQKNQGQLTEQLEQHPDERCCLRSA